MILVDTSVWVDHLRRNHARLKALLEAGQVLIHSFVIGELALGNLRQREAILQSLQDLPKAVSAGDGEVLGFIERNALFGLGIGYVDAQLLASARLSAALLWTHDKRLHEVAIRLGLAAQDSGKAKP
jgi:predicted nucleic acid-binding protein